jgi:predicted nucleotidyltransferase/uncharacterized protein (UPF0332 family)
LKKEEIYRDYDVAYDYATKVYQKFHEVVKSIVLFGSTAKETQRDKSDIDIIIIVDDVLIKWDQELIAWYREELGKLTSNSKYPKKLHVNTVTLSTFWNEILTGEPVVINVIRYGISLIDFGGFFEPLKILLARGKIKPSPEAIYNALKRAPFHMSRSKLHLVGAVDAIYWAMVDSAHAALMSAKQVPPSPEHIGAMLNHTFVKKGMLNSKYIDWYNEIYGLAHHISHGEITKVSGKFIEMYQERADKFIWEMAGLVKQLQ